VAGEERARATYAAAYNSQGTGARGFLSGGLLGRAYQPVNRHGCGAGKGTEKSETARWQDESLHPPR
jgi:hypothetical protein